MGKADSVAPQRVTIFPLSPAVLAGIGALQIAIALAFLSPHLIAAPLVVFLVLCLLAPFFPQARFFMPVITSGTKGKNAVALTFDDGPSPETTPLLLGLLKKYNVPATHFVIGNKMQEHPDLVRMMLAQGHTLANHTMNHDVFIMLKPAKKLGQEIEQCQNVMAAFGVQPLMFRPPVGIVSPRLWRELLIRGMHCVIFSLRARDMGNRKVAGIARRILGKVRDGDIIILHDRALKTKDLVGPWLKEVEQVITGIQAKGLRIIPLADLIERPIMAGVQDSSVHGPIAAFYDGIAGSYDQEQDAGVIARLRRTERAAVIKRLSSFVRQPDRVLEIGAGTGRYTLELARLAKEVVAVDVSDRMLQILRGKAQRAHLNNISFVRGDIQDIPVDHRFSHICAFSSLEYVPDLAALLKNLSGQLEPGGLFYCTTAHRTFFRFWAQIGNAMRQGVWLHARGRRQIRTALMQAGLTPLVIESQGTMSVLNAGVLLEILAKKEGAGYST